MPDIRSIIRRHLASLGLSGPQEEDIIEEAALDLEERYASALRDGVDPAEARGMVETQACQLAAELKTTLASDPQADTEAFGQLSPSQDSSSQTAWQRLLSWPFYLVQSGRHAAQILRKNLGFTMGATAMLGLCLGANLTIFAVIDSILLRPLPFPDGDRLVTTLHSYPLAEIPRSMASLPNYYDYRREIKAFESTAMIHTDYSGPTIVGGMGSPFKVDCDRVSPEFFHTLGVPLLLGRSFTEDEMTYSGSHVAVLTYPFWQTYFNGDPKVLGRTFDVDTVSTTVVGVLPKGFSYLSSHAQFYTPAASDPSERGANQRHNIRCQIIARLAPGATRELAQAQIATLDAAQLVNDPEGALIKSWGFRTLVDSLHGDHVRKIRPTVLLLQGGVLFLLLSAGVNLVNLLLVRASVRSKE
ncbi:MAG TPA: ABC transporter permease [Candidatus Limnocylindria bacterium]|nr:ABC transporter permease [Candidatus Limnocylindria bacterium]